MLWERYIQLTQIEAAFKSLPGELGIRPIFHQLQSRVKAHILVAFLGYCLLVPLKNRLAAYAPGLTPKAVLEKLGMIQMIDVWFPTTLVLAALTAKVRLGKYREECGSGLCGWRQEHPDAPGGPGPRICVRWSEPAGSGPLELPIEPDDGEEA